MLPLAAVPSIGSIKPAHQALLRGLDAPNLSVLVLSMGPARSRITRPDGATQTREVPVDELVDLLADTFAITLDDEEAAGLVRATR